MTTPDMPPQDEFSKAAQEKRGGLFGEIIGWLGANKKWWLLPIVIVMTLLGALIIFGASTGATPFIYTLF